MTPNPMMRPLSPAGLGEEQQRTPSRCSCAWTLRGWVANGITLAVSPFAGPCPHLPHPNRPGKGAGMGELEPPGFQLG